MPALQLAGSPVWGGRGESPKEIDDGPTGPVASESVTETTKAISVPPAAGLPTGDALRTPERLPELPLTSRDGEAPDTRGAGWTSGADEEPLEAPPGPPPTPVPPGTVTPPATPVPPVAPPPEVAVTPDAGFEPDGLVTGAGDVAALPDPAVPDPAVPDPVD